VEGAINVAADVTEVQDGVRQELLGLLLEKVENDRFPSMTMLDLVEAMIGPEEMPMYAEILMGKIRDDQFPSLNLIRRIKNLAQI
jgi:hypothetical protein